jgi:DNA mismatch endonuclease (patch repair protein)
MARVRQKHTHPELLVRKAAHRRGLRYRLHRGDLPGSPDLVFPKYRIALFVHGCYWHQHRGCARCTMPTNNRAYWSKKFEDNKTRDRRVNKKLRKLGWITCIVWECEALNPKVLEERLEQIFRMTA